MKLSVYIIIYLITLVYTVIKSKKAMHMLQQNLYNENNRYVKWMLKNIEPVLVSLSCVSVLSLALYQITKSFIFALIAILFLAIDAYLIRKREKDEQVKHSLVITARVKRLILTSTIIYLIPFIVYLFNKDLVYQTLLLLMVMAYFNYFVLLLAKLINRPVEKCVYLKFYHQATTKLKKTNVKVVGITGSYGKTSSKNILTDILNSKYITRPTPKNLNTEYGLMITINNHLDKFDEIFIAEMGAYKRGEIKTLCNMVNPKYGILTKIGTAHLETFGSQENIQKTKFELIESLPDDGIAVLNKDDELQVGYKIKSKCKKVWIGINEKDADVVASNIKCSYKGSTFDITFKGNKTKYKFETKLLGNNNIYNILASVALGHEFGMSIEELQNGVKKVKPIEHRLELKQLGAIYMMDDAYNSNPVGARSALEVLSMMNGTKVVVTPGMIELGEKQDELNKEFGRQIATISKADYVILVGKNITKPIYAGLLEENYDKEKIIIINDVTESYAIVNKLKKKEDIYALYENDLPDSYNERK